MTTISDLTRQVTFDDVWQELRRQAADIDAYRESFEKIFSELTSCTPEENTANMTVYLKLADDPMAEYCFDFGGEDESGDAEDAEGEEESAPYLQIFALRARPARPPAAAADRFINALYKSSNRRWQPA